MGKKKRRIKGRVTSLHDDNYTIEIEGGGGATISAQLSRKLGKRNTFIPVETNVTVEELGTGKARIISWCKLCLMYEN